MKWFLLIFVLMKSHGTFAVQNIINSLYLTNMPDSSDEFSMIGEFGFLLANGNTNASTITAKLNTSQELTSWSYQIIADALYKESQQAVNGEKSNETSAQKLFLSTQLDHKLAEPNERLFIYGEYENNRFSGFRYQAALAAGWSSRLWYDEQSEFKYSVGPGYAISEIEQGNSDSGTNSFIVRVAMEYKHKFSGLASFRQFVSIEAAQEFTKAKSETSLSTKITGALAMKLSFVMDLDTSVGTNIKELNTETAVILVYQFF